jgi:monoamine oxidase
MRRHAKARPATVELDALVIGGGAAGLAAAGTLARAGVHVAVLEARDRVGGRIWTVRRGAGGDPVELGAEFVHGEAPETVALARAAKLELVEVNAAELWKLDGRMREVPELRRALNAVIATAGSILPRGDDRPFREALDGAGVTEPWRSLALEYVGTFQAADVDRISARAVARGIIGQRPGRRVAGGYEGIVDALVAEVGSSSRAAVYTGCVVRSVVWSPGSIDLYAASGVDVSRTWAFHAPRAIVTLPLRILARPAKHDTRTTLPVLFDPPLEAYRSKRLALRALESGHAVRQVLRFRTPFWRAASGVRANAFFHVPGAAFPVLWTSGGESAQLVAWAGGPAATKLQPWDARTLASRALDVVSDAFGIERTTLSELGVGVAPHAWTADPFSLGAYSYPLAGGIEAGRRLADPLEHTLFFAGEATCDPPANGTVEGAIASGRRAAREVLAAAGGTSRHLGRARAR